MCNDSAVAIKEAAGAPEVEIEVTPEMIEAGEMELWRALCGSDLHPAFYASETAKRVFLVMSGSKQNALEP